MKKFLPLFLLYFFPLKKTLALLVFLVAGSFQLIYATNIQSTGAGGNWNNAASWSPAQVPVAGDIVTINNGSPIVVTAAATCATLTINANGSLTLNGGGLTVSGSCTINGKLDCKTGYDLTGTATLTINNNATIGIGDAFGITAGNVNGPMWGSIQTTGNARNFPFGANYIYDGTVNQATGTGLPNTINNNCVLTIDNTGAAGNNIVSLSAAGANNFQNITLAAGTLSLNGKFINVTNGTILNTGGNLATTGIGGADGGTVTINNATLTGPTTFYNLTCSSNNSTITTSGLNAPLIDGTLTISSARFGGANSPRYAPGSTLLYSGPNNRGLEWNADLTTPATIGVTQGYPDNVTITSGSDFDICNYPMNGNDGAIPRGLNGNLTASELTMLDWIPYSTVGGPYYLNPLLNQTGSFTVGGNMIVNAGGNINMSKVPGSGAFIIKGSLTINGASANVDLDSMTNVFSVGNGIILNNGTINVGFTGVASNLQVTGNVVQNGGTINDQSGVFSLTGNFTKTGGTFNSLAGTMEFNSTTGSQTFSTNLASETFNNLIVNETAGNLTLSNNLNLTGDLTLTNGLINTGANTLAITNGNANITRTNGWVNGIVQRNITTASQAYIFPVGDATNYTPATLTFATVTTAGNLTVTTNTPFTSVPGYATDALSKTKYVDRYWTLTKNSGTFGTYTGLFDYGTTSLVGGANVSNLHVGAYDGANWTYPGSAGAGTAVTGTAMAALGAGSTSIALSECLSPVAYNVTGGGGYCTGGTGAVVGLSNSQTGINYQLQIGGVNTGAVVAGTNSAISFGNQTATGTYTVNAINAATGCPSAMNGSVTVSINPLPTVTFTAQPGATACANTNVTYTTQAGETNYLWTIPGVAGTDYTIISGGTSTDNTVTLAWLTAGNKTVTINYSDANSCSATTATSSTATTVTASPVISVTSGNPSSCGANNGSIQVSGLAASTSYTINYDKNAVPVASQIFTSTPGGAILLTGLTQGSYTNITATPGASCTSNAVAATLTDPSAPIPTFTAAPGANSCTGSSVTYTTQTGESNYTWSVPGTAGTDYTITSGGISSTDNTVTLTWITAGSKTVTVNYTNSGCTAASPASSVTLVINTPVVSGYANQVELQQGYSIVLQGTVADTVNNTIVWSPNSYINDINTPNPMVAPLADQLYTMVVTPNGLANCSSTVSVLVQVQLPLAIPSSFSPNADGVHDIWYIKNIDQYPNAKVEIFNRFGQVVFEIQGDYLAAPWNGNLNGSPLPTGTYYYVINLNNGTSPSTGYIALIR